MTSRRVDSDRFAVTNVQNLYGELACRIVLGDFVEDSELDLTDWTVEDYVRQWREALLMLVENDDAKVILMTWGSHPESGRVRRGWRLHRSGINVRVQENIYVPGDHHLFVDKMGAVVDGEAMESMTEDGYRISEWGTTVESIRRFLADG